MVPSFRVFIPAPTTRGTSGKRGHGTIVPTWHRTISYADLSDKLVNALRSFRGADATAGLVGRRAVDVAT